MIDHDVDTPRSLVWRALKRDRLAMSGLFVLLLLTVVAVVGFVLTNTVDAFNPATVRLTDKLVEPMGAASDLIASDERPFAGIYWLGTDALGRDVLSRMLQGAGVSLSIGFVAVGLSVFIGVLVGATAGYFLESRVLGISLDTLLMRLTDAMLCFPTFFLVLTVVALLPASTLNIMIVIGLTSWMGTARLVRGEVLSLKSRDYIAAAVAAGLPGRRIITHHLLPNAMAPVLVSASIGIATAILTESALSFLGFGVQPPDATWGNVLADGKNYILDAPWLFLFPGAAILVVVLAFNLLGEGAREALTPTLNTQVR
ncbi:MAG: peptide ABC transporter permease [Gammaproteobacteria bacterium]|nr:peptide ABC transporter permease [Gammaproteobacteria bacterium]